MEPILSQGYGYGFALGLGAAFAILMLSITKVLDVYLGQKQNSERFSTASRSVKSGLIASSTVSAWTWPATLLTSGTWSYEHGLSGGFLYGIAGTIQITLFLFLAIQIKRNAPSAHTVSEVFHARFGKSGHWMFLFYCIATNVLISACLLLGGSQGFAAATGMHVVAASFLLPLNVIVYTTMGGLKATFVSDWIHTVIIYVILIVTGFTIYCTSSEIGSPGKMYDLLVQAQDLYPSATGKSYLSFHDPSMYFLTWSVAIGGLSSVFCDPGYSQRAIASDSTSVFWGYLMGGICWWIIPFALGSSGGLACRALLNSPSSVTYPRALTTEEINAGLPVIYGMAAIFGKSGAAAGLVTLFMSVTSATSAELIAFSSVATYDIYRLYFKPEASGKQLVRFAHISVVGFGFCMAIIAIILNYVGVNVGWIISFLGIILTPAVSAVTYTLFWSKMTKLSLLIGCPLGTATGIGCWIGATYHYANGVVDKDTLMTTEATFIGNIAACSSAAIYIAIISFIKPNEVPYSMSQLDRDFTLGDDVDKEGKEAVIVNEDTKKLLKRHSMWSLIANLVILIGCYVVLSVGLYASKHDLSKSSFTGLIIVMLMWLLLAALYIVIMPLWQGRHSIAQVISHFTTKKTIDNDISEPVSEDVSVVEEVHAPKE